MSVSDPEDKDSFQFCGFLSSVYCILVTHSLHRKSNLTSHNMCVTQFSVESEIISLDADLRMDAVPALDLWDLIIDVMHSNSNQKQKDKRARKNLSRSKTFKKLNSQMNTPVSQGYLELSNDDFVSSDVNSGHKGTMFYIFEVNEAVIKLIMKGQKSYIETCLQDPQGYS